MEHLTIFGCALFCAGPILWLKGPRRSEMWRHLIEGLDWLRAMCEDALIVAELRERRRDSRRKLRQTAAVLDNGREYQMEGRV